MFQVWYHLFHHHLSLFRLFHRNGAIRWTRAPTSREFSPQPRNGKCPLQLSTLEQSPENAPVWHRRFIQLWICRPSCFLRVKNCRKWLGGLQCVGHSKNRFVRVIDPFDISSQWPQEWTDSQLRAPMFNHNVGQTWLPGNSNPKIGRKVANLEIWSKYHL